MTTVSDIAKIAFDAAAGAISGVIQTATLSEPVQGAYDAATRQYIQSTVTHTGRGVIGTEKALKHTFPAYQVGPEDTLILMEGFTVVPKVGWTITIGGVARDITAVGDIAGAGGFFEVIAR